MNMIKGISLALVASVGLAGTAIGRDQVVIRGSDTMLILNQRWAEAFSRQGGLASVAVTGGGSSIGIRSFINGVADIAASSRPMRPREVASARSRGAIANAIPVALDGLAIAVNANNPMTSISIDQLRRIFTGSVTNWSQLGGPNAPIVVFGRDSNSGTFGFFQDNILRGQNWGKSVRFLPSTSEIAREVGRTENGIGYGGVAFFKERRNLKILPVSPRAGADPVAPTEDNVRSKRYPIWRYLYFYTNGRPSGETKKFIDFVLSPAGQRIADEVGFYSLRQM